MKKVELLIALKQYREGNKDSFEEIYKISYPYLHTCVRNIIGNDEEAIPDIMQEIYLQICKSIHQLRDDNAFLGWAAHIARGKCSNYLDKRKKRKDEEVMEIEEEFWENVSEDEAFIPENILQNQEKVRLIKEIIDNLNPQQRYCVIGFYYNEEKQDKLAEELGIPVNTVKSHLNRAKGKIKEAIIELEEKKGTKLYSMAPFMLLFFAKEAEACEVPPMPQPLTEVAQANAAEKIAQEAGKAGLKGIGVKIGVGAVIAGVVIAGIWGLTQSTKEPEESVAIVEETNDIVEENTEEQPVAQEEVAEEIAEPEGVGRLLGISNLYESYKGGADGLMVVGKDEKWGLVTYDNEIVVPIEYDYSCWMPNDDGQTWFVNDGDYKVFDREGNVLFASEKSVGGVTDNIVLVEESNRDEYTYNCQYYSLDGELICELPKKGSYGESGALCFNDGFATMSNDENLYFCYEDGTVEVSDYYEEEVEEVIEEGPFYANVAEGWRIQCFYPIGTSYNGCFVTKAIGYGDVYGKYEIWDTKNEIISEFYIKDICDYLGWNFWENYEIAEDLKWTVYGFRVDGDVCYCYNNLISVVVTKDNISRGLLIDVSKIKDIPGTRYPEYEQTKELSEAVLVEGTYVNIGNEKYWLYSDGEQWGYVDHDGNIMNMYDSAAEFYDGDALVVLDSKCYAIDENFNIIEEIVSAEYVERRGNIFAIETDEGTSFYAFN